MKSLIKSTLYWECSPEELEAEYGYLKKIALSAAEDAYAPYSTFCVGAALELEDGTIVRGSNQENASSPCGLCAERAALYHAGSYYPKVAPKRLLILAVKNGKMVNVPTTPCGACRQTMVETEMRYGKKMEVLMWGAKKVWKVESAADLLPLGFNAESMEEGR